MKLLLTYIISLFIISSLFAVEVNPSNSPNFIVHLLDYLAADYGGAVQHGKVISQNEYSEQMEFAETVHHLAATLPEVKNEVNVVKKISYVKSLIEKKADASEVASAARAAQKELINTLKIVVAPAKIPNYEHGKKLFAQNCTGCHGSTGMGDGELGKTLDPKPANFHKAERMNEISLFHCFNTIRMGVPGTAMASWQQFTDSEVWDLASFVIGVRYEKNQVTKLDKPISLDIKTISTSTDEQIKNKLIGDEDEKSRALAFIRTYFNRDNDNDGIKKARRLLTEAKETYEKKDFNNAEKIAVNAYLEGIEPIEPALKANNPDLLPKIENAMSDFRKEIKKENNLSAIEEKITNINLILDEVQTSIKKEEMSFGVAFSGSFAIILREGFEAVLVIITLLSILKAFNNRRAILAVHLGWILALGVGIFTWLVSGVLIQISGLGQEMMEAVTSVLAVVILLYFGFWLHRQTEITRWKKFIEEKVQNAIDNSNLIAIGSISFMAAYREAFETVLFIRTIWTQSGTAGKNGIGIGLALAFAVIFAFSLWAIKYSAKLPIKNLFRISAWMMCGLAFILAGKAVHAFQSVGVLNISTLPINFNLELIGVHSTFQTITAQILVGIFSVALLKYSQKKAE